MSAGSVSAVDASPECIHGPSKSDSTNAFSSSFSPEALDGPESDDASGFSVRFTDANTNVHDNSGTVYSLLEVLLTGLIMRLS